MYGYSYQYGRIIGKGGNPAAAIFGTYKTRVLADGGTVENDACAIAFLESIGAGLFDADYQSVLDYATAQGYTLPSGGQQTLQNDLLVALKAAGVWSKLDTFANFATDGDSDFALIDWKRLAQNTAVNSPTFTINEGFTTNGTSSVIDITYNPSTSGTNYTQNDASFGVYRFAGAGIRGVWSNGLSQSGMIFDSSGAFQGVNSTNTRTYTSGTRFTSASTGLLALHRPSSLIFNLSDDGVIISQADQTSTSLPTGFDIGRDAFVFSSWTCSFFFAGSSLISEISDFSNAVNSYMSSI